MKNPVALFGALGVGAGLMYFLDPERGNRRRALIRDRAVHLSNVAEKELRRKKADLRNRVQGFWFETERLFENETIADGHLEGRIRSRLGRLTSHPHAVKTTVDDGKVTLRGLMPADEAEIALKGISEIRGVREVVNELDIDSDSAHISSVRGGRQNRETIFEKQKEWSAKTRFLAAAAGVGLVFRAVKKRNVASPVLGSVGIGLLARSAANKPLDRLFAGHGEGTVKVQKAITIEASADKVFDVLKHPQYFPNFMSHVRKVEPIGEKQFLWSVDGAVGKPIEVATEVTSVEPNRLIAWKNAAGQGNGQTGRVRLEEVGPDTTRLHLEMDYQPPGGAIGYLVAALLKRDPKSELDDDFLRLKTYVEKGKLPRDAAICKKTEE